MILKRSISYGRQTIEEDDIQAVVEVLRGDYLTQGPSVALFEQNLAQYCGARHAIAVANGTVALHFACLAAGMTHDDEGITSPITFLASANCMVYCGAKPVFSDIDPHTWNIDPTQIKMAITEKTKVIIPVHFGGLPCDMREIHKIACKNKLIVIEDACHALGAEYSNGKIGNCEFSNMVCFSFHPVKNITTGEGGAILTNDDDFAQRLKSLRHHHITKDPGVIGHNAAPWYYEAHEVGYNGRITDIQCALGVTQLNKLDRFIQRRQDIASRYRSELQNVPGLSFQQTPSISKHAYHLFIVHLDPQQYDRRAVYGFLKEHNITPQIHYIPLHNQPLMKELSGSFPSINHADKYYEGCLSLPMYPLLEDREQNYIIQVLKEALDAFEQK